MSESAFLVSGVAPPNPNRGNCFDDRGKIRAGFCYAYIPGNWLGSDVAATFYHFTGNEPVIYEIEAQFSRLSNSQAACRTYFDEKAKLVAEKHGKFDGAPAEGVVTQEVLASDPNGDLIVNGDRKRVTGYVDVPTLDTEMTRGQNKIHLHSVWEDYGGGRLTCIVSITYKNTRASDNPF
jgi:hypothetical protein